MKKNIMIALLFAIGLGQMAPVMAMKGQNSFSSSFKQIPNKQISKTNRDIIRNYKVNDYDGIYIRKFMVAMCNNEQASVCFNDFFDEIFDSSKNYYFDEMHFVESFFKEQFCDHCSHFLKQNIVTQLSEEDLQIYLDCHNVEDFKNMIINDLQNFFRKKQADYVYCSLRDGLLYNSVGDYIQSKLSSDSEHSKKRIFDIVCAIGPYM